METTNVKAVPDEVLQQQSLDTSSSSISGPEQSASLHARSDVFDDVWGEPPLHVDDDGNRSGVQPTSSIAMTPDLRRLRTTHVTAGYRDGVAAAREGAAQGGFDEGYLLGAAIGIRAGYLQGVIEGLENGLDLGALDAASRHAFESPLQQAKQELQLSSLLSEQYISTDGAWKWPVEPLGDQQEPTIGTVADAHPMLQRVNRTVSIYAHKLGVHRRESA